jgi:hypothetical protein
MDVDKANYELRQRMLSLMDQTRTQEASVKREAVLTTRTTQLQDDALRQTERQLKLKEATLEEYKDQCEAKVSIACVTLRRAVPLRRRPTLCCFRHPHVTCTTCHSQHGLIQKFNS